MFLKVVLRMDVGSWKKVITLEYKKNGLFSFSLEDNLSYDFQGRTIASIKIVNRSVLEKKIKKELIKKYPLI